MSPAIGALCFTLFWAGPAADVRPAHLFVTGKTLMTVRLAVDGAARRLGTAECQHLLDDFADGSGRPLSEVLAATGLALADFLATLYFVDGVNSRPCHVDGVTEAFTRPGQRVIYVCQRFGETDVSSRTYAEIVIIHEMLHALGLGENPPSSREITRQVMRRCGR